MQISIILYGMYMNQWIANSINGVFDLSSYGPDNWDFTEQDYNDAKVRAIDACREFYKDKWYGYVYWFTWMGNVHTRDY